MATIISKSTTPCEYCARTIPVGTEIANETRKSWHIPCHAAVVQARKLVDPAVSALRSHRLEDEAEAIRESTEKAALILAACEAAETALDKRGVSASSEARSALKAYRGSVPESVTGAGAHNARAAALIGGHVSKIRKGE